MAGRTGPKRKPQQKAADLEFIARHRIRGKTLTEIAKMISDDPDRPYTLSYVQVRQDAEDVGKVWAANAMEYTQQGKDRVCATLDAVEEEAWKAYERSQKPRMVKRIKQHKPARLAPEAGKDTGPEIIGKREDNIQTEDQNGDPAFLDLILKCAEKRARIMGVEAPQKVTMTDQAGAPVPVLGVMPVINVMLPEGTHDPFTAISIPGTGAAQRETTRN